MILVANLQLAKSQCISCTSSESLNNSLLWCIPIENNATDYSGNNYHGTTNAITYGLDRFNKANGAAYFNGSSSYIDLAKNIPDITNFSISFWIKMNASTPDQILFWEGNSVCGNDFIIGTTSSKIYLRADKNGASLNGISNSNTQYAITSAFLSSWHMITWTSTGAVNKFFVDTNLVFTVNTTSNVSGYHNTPTFGCSNDGNTAPCGFPRSGFFNGALDDLRFYTKTLTDIQVQQLYHKLNSVFTPAVVSPILTCSGDSVQLHASGGSIYTWKPDPSLSSLTIANPKVKPSFSHFYFVNISTSYCSQDDTVLVDLDSAKINLGPDRVSCFGDTLKLQPTFSGSFITWYPDSFLSDRNSFSPLVIKPPYTMQYIARVQHATCIAFDTIQIFLRGANFKRISDTSMCEGKPITLKAGPATSYHWYPNYQINYTDSMLVVVNPLVDTTYYLDVVDSVCLLKDTIHVDVIQNPIVQVDPLYYFCKNKSVQLVGNVSKASGFYWSPGVFLDDSTKLNPVFSGASSDQLVTLIAYDSSHRCVSSVITKLQLDNSVKAKFTSNPTAGTAPLLVNFTNSSTAATNYLWNFTASPKDTSSAKNPSFTFTSNGKYVVKLLATSAHGCKDSAYFEIDVIDPFDFHIPDAFTPNGDNINDVFSFPFDPAVLALLKMKIYSRHNECLYETRMPGGNWWDGTFNSVDVPIGVYFYTIEAYDKQGNSATKSGNISLIR